MNYTTAGESEIGTIVLLVYLAQLGYMVHARTIEICNSVQARLLGGMGQIGYTDLFLNPAQE